MDSTTVGIPCQVVDLNNNCQCSTVEMATYREPTVVELIAPTKLFPTVVAQAKQVSESTAVLTHGKLRRIGAQNSLSKRLGSKWHPYRLATSPMKSKAHFAQSNLQNLNQIRLDSVVELVACKEGDCSNTTSTSKEDRDVILLFRNKVECIPSEQAN
ncbi:hypothetical protein ZHAS_00004769 [Anopheles sinensis]|uniref:Uncharacterized protein n=1 Tax=Anopheles sinensis TaxID=74873 RepID=A0A084VHU5_ANOSI|nr:hypothetical protein ZHAS_00004769 [Anopheles sinensis]